MIKKLQFISILALGCIYNVSSQNDSINNLLSIKEPNTINIIRYDSKSTLSAPKKIKLNPWEGVNAYRFSVGNLKDMEMEASYLITSFPQQDPGFGGIGMFVQYIGAGLECIKDGTNYAVGTKLSYETTFLFFSAQIGTDYLYSDTGQQVRIMPKIGLSIIGVVTFYYGYNHNLIESSRLQPNKNIISLQINLYDLFFNN